MSTREERLELRLQGDAAYTTRAPSVTATALRHHHFKLYGQSQQAGSAAALPQIRRTRNDQSASNNNNDTRSLSVASTGSNRVPRPTPPGGRSPSLQTPLLRTSASAAQLGQQQQQQLQQQLSAAEEQRLLEERRERAREMERLDRQREQERIDREELIPDSKKAPQVRQKS